MADRRLRQVPEIIREAHCLCPQWLASDSVPGVRIQNTRALQSDNLTGFGRTAGRAMWDGWWYVCSSCSKVLLSRCSRHWPCLG